MNNDWYKDFFSGLSVELWQQVLPQELSVRDVQFAEKQLQLSVVIVCWILVADMEGTRCCLRQLVIK